MQKPNEYIHPESIEIERFIQELHLAELPFETAVSAVFRWFDRNVSYSRLNAPYSPLQRSDLDVLAMKSGTCGDYANLIVSTFTRLGYRTSYAVIQVDCYGDPQDHICAAVRYADRWRLIDATLPYRKWGGSDCPHREYMLLSYDEMKNKWEQEQRYWMNKAAAWKRTSFAGLLYAPWMHEEIVLQTEQSLETVFFMLLLDDAQTYHIDVYYFVYTKETASCAVLCRLNKEDLLYRFSVNRADNLWDEKQWSEPYPKTCIPERFRTPRLSNMTEQMNRIVPAIRQIIGSE